jgi:hypothetical protein
VILLFYFFHKNDKKYISFFAKQEKRKESAMSSPIKADRPNFLQLHSIREQYGIKECAVRKAMKRGEIRFVKKGAGLLFERNDIETWLRNGLQKVEVGT